MRHELKQIKKELKNTDGLLSWYLTDGDDLEGLAIFNADSEEGEFDGDLFKTVAEYLYYCWSAEDMPEDIYQDLLWQLRFEFPQIEKEKPKALFFHTIANPGFTRFKSNKELMNWLKEQVPADEL